eukprot:jgi/Mesvir1/12328/Mv00517-RA.2
MDRTVGKLRMSTAVTCSESMTVIEAVREMAKKRADCVLLLDSQSLLSGIMTDKDVATKLVAAGLPASTTPASAIMTRGPTFCTKDSNATDALRKMVDGKFRHLPVVDEGEVRAVLDITKCLFHAIFMLERSSEGADKGNPDAPSGSVLESMRARMLKPTLASLVAPGSSAPVVSSNASVVEAAIMMKRCHTGAVLVAGGAEEGGSQSLSGIVTSKDILFHVIAKGEAPELTCVTQVMTLNPEFAPITTPILDALHILHDGRFLHLPVVQDGTVVTIIDVLMLIQGALAQLDGKPGSPGHSDIMRRFLELSYNNGEANGGLHGETDRETVSTMSEHEAEPRFVFKMERPASCAVSMSPHKSPSENPNILKFFSSSSSLRELRLNVTKRLGGSDPEALEGVLKYVDEDGDAVTLGCDADVQAAVRGARLHGAKFVLLSLDESARPKSSRGAPSSSRSLVARVLRSPWTWGIATSAGVGVGIYLYMSPEARQSISDKVASVTGPLGSGGKVKAANS